MGLTGLVRVANPRLAYRIPRQRLYRHASTSRYPPPSHFPSGHPPPPKPKESSSNLNYIFWGAQFIFGAGLSFLAGYYVAAWRNASTLSNNAGDTSLVPSVIAVRRQELSPPSYGSKKDYDQAIEDIKKMLRRKGLSLEDRVSIDPSDLESHGVSDWSYHEEKRPTVVVWVETTEEVQEIMLIARQHRVPITPYGGATSLEGHFSSPYGGISLDLSRMNRILRVSEADGDATVQCGVKWEDLNEHLAANNVPLFFPLDPGPGATIGGMVGTGCSGTNAVRYGTAKAEWFLNLTVVLPSGEIIKTRQRARKSSAGWDTTKLFIGAEGTLGIVTEATLRLAPLMPTKCAVVTFNGVEEAVSAATEVVNAGFPVQCVEFLDARTMKAINQGGISGRQYPEKDCLFFKFQGTDSAMADVSKGVQAVTKKHGGKDFTFSRTDKEAQDLWQGRKAALWSVLALREGARVWTTDVCVPISELPRLIRETTEDFEQRGLTACHFGHVGDGNVHSLALFSDDDELAKIREAVHEMVERAIRLDGTCTGEHGVGLGKVEYLDGELGRGTVNLMETVKRTLDPFNLLNPGKIYPHIKPVAPKL
ncbi:putative D-lactate dehydrogenase oxidoreductase protein [Kockovaella imperatae]|uniref:D-lactate dehydrogenase (cytochrome) n=1 Tax=Kockovaella imperatae TaxID=4999 RepID=A0A1Y1UGR8_9TREE|nr:putative D-lactate dehydrogenase oxidoreductase protein [Kockovaella imperatae]ORX36265.1 putative D-lactate dehydrogenase oxidoreductase protein [Kockovaella imperatae]